MITDAQLVRSARNKLNRCGFRLRKARNQNLYCVYFGDIEVRWFDSVTKLALYAEEVAEKFMDKHTRTA